MRDFPVSLRIKICGLKTPESVECALEAGADMIGLNFHPRSPRYVAPDLAAVFMRQMAGRAQGVALVVDAEDLLLAALHAGVSPDLWQFHGKESPMRIREARAASGLPVMKAIGIGSKGDIAEVASHADVADMILLDAKPPKDAAYPGGHGRVFDWGLLSTLPPDMPFMLSGGLTPENVGEAIRTVRAMGLDLVGVDVSSGVESAPGIKDIGKIRAFIAEVRANDRREEDGK